MEELNNRTQKVGGKWACNWWCQWVNRMETGNVASLNNIAMLQCQEIRFFIYYFYIFITLFIQFYTLNLH